MPDTNTLGNFALERRIRAMTSRRGLGKIVIADLLTSQPRRAARNGGGTHMSYSSCHEIRDSAFAERHDIRSSSFSRPIQRVSAMADSPAFAQPSQFVDISEAANNNVIFTAGLVEKIRDYVCL